MTWASSATGWWASAEREADMVTELPGMYWAIEWRGKVGGYIRTVKLRPHNVQVLYARGTNAAPDTQLLSCFWACTG